MKHRISHDLGTDLAVKATRAAVDSYTQRFAKYDPRVRWLSNTTAEILFKVKLVKLTGTVEVTDDTVLFDLEVPLMLRVFKDKAVRVIDDEVRTWIAKAKAGELS